MVQLHLFFEIQYVSYMKVHSCDGLGTSSRPQSRSLESQVAGLQSLWLASLLKPWLSTADGLWWLATAYEYKQEN